MVVSVPDSVETIKRVTERGARDSVPRTLNPWEHLNYFAAGQLVSLLEAEGFHYRCDFRAAWDDPLGFNPLATGVARIRNMAGVLLRGWKWCTTGLRKSTSVVVVRQ
jgi:hypothetical protein